MNTAPAEVLLAAACDLAQDQEGVGPCNDPLQLVQVAALIQGITMLRTIMPFARITDFTKALQNPESFFITGVPGIQLSPDKFAAQRNMLTTRSTVFSIYSEATVGRVTKRIHMVVDMSLEVTLTLPEDESLTTAGGKVLYYRMD